MQLCGACLCCNGEVIHVLEMVTKDDNKRCKSLGCVHIKKSQIQTNKFGILVFGIRISTNLV